MEIVKRSLELNITVALLVVVKRLVGAKLYEKNITEVKWPMDLVGVKHPQHVRLIYLFTNVFLKKLGESNFLTQKIYCFDRNRTSILLKAILVATLSSAIPHE